MRLNVNSKTNGNGNRKLATQQPSFRILWRDTYLHGYSVIIAIVSQKVLKMQVYSRQDPVAINICVESHMTSENTKTNQDAVLIGGVEKRKIVIERYNPHWPVRFAKHKGRIEKALGQTAMRIEHVGSTSVPGLAAKPIVDMIVEVPNSADEDSYLPQMEVAGYVLRVREPDWHEHRMFRTPALDVHIHVFSEGATEIDRNLAFRDHLRNNAEDLKLYESVKFGLAAKEWPDMNAYAKAKTDVIEDVLSRATPRTKPPAR